ncbi:MAG: class I SAM-dependent methyltransferase [Rubripirellula sp.]
MLHKIDIPSKVDSRPVPDAVAKSIELAKQRIETFQDRWDRPQIEQFVAADYRHVFQALDWTLETQMTIGRRFVEWGCGFAIVSACAAHLGLDVIGIESEDVLLAQGRTTVGDWGVPVELIHGNFLPPGAESLADDPMLPSLGHEIENAYESLGLDLDDFAMVYSYPWPGEDDFHEAVFDRYAARGALLMMFCGPNDIRLYRKT